MQQWEEKICVEEIVIDVLYCSDNGFWQNLLHN